ncbi:holin, partial [Escherichia coli]|nr:holin [Escherichia coli]
MYSLNLHPLCLRGGVMKSMDKLTTGVAYGDRK